MRLRDADRAAVWAEPRRRVMAHVGGLLAPVEHKNGWQSAKVAGVGLEADLLRYTVPEVRRLVWQRPPDRGAAPA